MPQPGPATQAPVVWPAAIWQTVPRQQSLVDVQVAPGATHWMGAAQKPFVHTAEQQVVASAQAVPFCRHAGAPASGAPPSGLPASGVPPSVAGGGGCATAQKPVVAEPSNGMQVAGAQQVFGPDGSQPTGPPAGVHDVCGWQVNPPLGPGRQGARPQHWSRNWQLSPALRQQLGSFGSLPYVQDVPAAPKQRGTPFTSRWQTSFPSQQLLFMGKVPTGAPVKLSGLPQVLPAGLQAPPLSQRPGPVLVMPPHVTLWLAGAPGTRQHWSVERHVSPVMRQPPAGWQTFTPLPGSSHTSEQQLDAPEHGFPSCVQPPAAPPVMVTHRPGLPFVPEQTPPQHSPFEEQTSPFDWHVYARAQTPPWQFVEQQSTPVEHASPSTLHVPPARTWHVPPEQTPLQQAPDAVQAAPVAVQEGAANGPASAGDPASGSALPPSGRAAPPSGSVPPSGEDAPPSGTPPLGDPSTGAPPLLPWQAASAAMATMDRARRRMRCLPEPGHRVAGGMLPEARCGSLCA
jgi:hypothetical protein